MGCNAAEDSVETGEEQFITEGGFELYPAGFFEVPEDANWASAVLLHTGFVADNGDWLGIVDTPIAYVDGKSTQLNVAIPDAYEGMRLGYTVQRSTSYGLEFWSAVGYVDTTRPAGTWVDLPISSSASYPFAPECYGVSVNEYTAGGPVESGFAGPHKVDFIYLGFTDSSPDDYFANNDVPWENTFGEATAEATMPISYVHDGGYKGAYFISLPRVRVPADRNLVFKLNVSKYGGTCLTDNDTQMLGSSDTKTYFTPVRDSAN